jgi:hypothetical protein
MVGRYLIKLKINTIGYKARITPENQLAKKQQLSVKGKF